MIGFGKIVKPDVEKPRVSTKKDELRMMVLNEVKDHDRKGKRRMNRR